MDLQRWLLTEGRRSRDVPALLDALGPRMADQLGVSRFWAGTTVLHPQAAAYAWVWEPTGLRNLVFSHEQFASFQDLDTPIKRLRDGAEHVRFRAGDGDEGLVELTEVFAAGHTDYYAEGLFLRGAWAGGFAWTTRDPEGFADADIAALHGMVPALSAVVEPLIRDAMYTTLLRTYLGRDAGQRVASGQVRRGDGDAMRAAIWFSDVRGFTRLSATLERHALLRVLDRVFQDVVDSVHGAGGEVLKFMGDGVLAIFTDDADGHAACAAATRAAEALQQRLAAWPDDGSPRPGVGVGLHYGDLLYGNIGAPARLDFTVLGPSVNLAARIEGLCGELGQAVLCSNAIAERTEGWVDAGAFELKGFSDPVPVLARA